MNRPAASDVYRDYETDGDPSSGPWSPQKSDIRDLFVSRGQLPSDFDAVGDTCDVSDFAIVADTNVLSSPSGLLQTAIEGQSVCVFGAGDAGAPLYTTITDASNAPESVVVADAASVTVAAAGGFYGTDDTDALTAWAAAGAWLRADPTAIYTISAALALPPVIKGRLRLRMTSDIGAITYGARAGGTDVGAAQAVGAVAAGATSFVPADATQFRVGDFFRLGSNQIISAASFTQLGELGLVKSVNGDGSITAAEPLKCSYGNFRVASLKFGATPGAGYAGGDFNILVGGTLLAQPVSSVNVAANAITIGMAPPMGGLLDHFTGALVQVRSTAGLPAGLAANTNYYCGNVVLGNGAFTCQLFTVQADALAGEGASLVNITSVGGGAISVTMPMMIRVRAVSATGAILDWAPVTWGSYQAVPAVPATFTTTGAGVNAEAQSVVLEACTVKPAAAIVPDLDLEIMGDGDSDNRGLLISYAKGGAVRISGANCARLAEIASCQDMHCETGNVSNIAGDGFAGVAAVTGASKRVTIRSRGEQHGCLRSVCISPNGPANNTAIVQDTVIEDLHIAATVTASATAAVTAVDAATGANLITIAAPLSPGDAVVIATGAGATLPGGLAANETVYAGNVTVFNGAATFQPYTTYDDALDGLSVNVVDLTTAGAGALTATISQGGEAITAGEGQIGTIIQDSTVMSSAANAISVAGGNIKIADCTLRGASANGVRVANASLYAATWKIDGVSVQGSARCGVRINGAAYAKDRLQLGRLATRASQGAGLRAVAGKGGMIVLEHPGSVRSDHDSLGTTSGCVMLSGVEGPATPALSIEGVPAAGIGLRLTGCKGLRPNPARIVAGGAAAKLALVELSASHIALDGIDAYDAGFATITGIDVSDATITNVTVGANCDFHNCATPVAAGASSGANSVGVITEKTIFANHAGSPYTAPNGRVRYLTDSTAGVIVINPNAHPSATDAITIKDDAGTAQTNQVTFGGAVGPNDNTVINRQGDFARYDYSSNQARWSQTQ